MRKMCEKYPQTMLVVTHDEKIAQTADRILISRWKTGIGIKSCFWPLQRW